VANGPDLVGSQPRNRRRRSLHGWRVEPSGDPRRYTRQDRPEIEGP
jgi:hypothetical protein